VFQTEIAKWGNEVTLHGSANFKERALRLAVERGMNVNNPELQDRQREFAPNENARALWNGSNHFGGSDRRRENTIAVLEWSDRR